MTITVAVVGTTISLAAIGWAAASDPKRRRSFGMTGPARPRARRAAAVAVILPGLIVALWGGASGLFVWLGAVLVAGWCIVALPPLQHRSSRARAVSGRTRAHRQSRRTPAPATAAPGSDDDARIRGQLVAESGLDQWRPLQDSNLQPAD